MSDSDTQAEAATEEIEEKGEALDDQFAAADAEAEVGESPEVEALASEVGWTPRDKFKGPPEKWKPASEFIKVGRNESRNLKRTVDELRQTMDTIAKTNGAIMQDKLVEQHRALEQKYAGAVERGDADEAWRVGNEIRDLKDMAETVARPTPRAPDEVTVAWAERNQWMKTHPIARQIAIEVADQFAREGAPAEVQTREAEAVVRQQFPHLFAEGGHAATVNGPRSRAAARAPRGTTYKDMPKEAQAIADDLVERGVVDDKERYARNYFAQAQKG